MSGACPQVPVVMPGACPQVHVVMSGACPQVPVVMSGACCRVPVVLSGAVVMSGYSINGAGFNTSSDSRTLFLAISESTKLRSNHLAHRNTDGASIRW